MHPSMFSISSPRMPCKPIYNLHSRQVGRLLAASLLPTSRKIGEACNSQQESGIPYYKCGFKKTYHEHGRVARYLSVKMITHQTNIFNNRF